MCNLSEILQFYTTETHRGEFYLPIQVGGPVCTIGPNFWLVRQSFAEIWPFFKMVAVRHLGFLKFENFNCM